MQEGPRVEKCPIAIKFWGTHVIAMGVTAYGPVHHGYIKNHQLLVEIANSDA